MQDVSYKNSIDREYINLAIRHFLEKGGEIKVLPPQKISNKTIISRHEWSAYESIEDFIA